MEHGDAKLGILAFIRRSTTEGPEFIVPAERIATFDNDGTLWVEQPMPPQFDFVFAVGRGDQGGAVTGAASSHTGRSSRETRRSSLGWRPRTRRSSRPSLEAFGRSWNGTTPESSTPRCATGLTTAKQPKLGVRTSNWSTKPMLELIEFFKANDYRVFVCSGGGRDFMRVFAEETWGSTRRT